MANETLEDVNQYIASRREAIIAAAPSIGGATLAFLEHNPYESGYPMVESGA